MPALKDFVPGFRLIDGGALNLIVAAVNNMTGNGTPAPGTFSTLSATGVVSVSNGAVGAPAVAFTSDPDTGIYRTAANSLGIAAGGALVATFNSTGFNGVVGGTTPAAGSFTTIGASGVVTLSVGAVGTPALTFTGDTNTGLYWVGADSFAATVGGAAVATFTATGVQGAIGQTTPDAGAFTFARQSVSAGLTATGNDRATSLALTSAINVIGTAAASTGVTLPSAATVGIGAEVTIFNNGANAVQVYGAGSDTIDGVAGATGVPLTNAKRAVFYVTAAATWISAQLGVVSA